MDAVSGARAASRRQGRRWLFASAILDERSWTLLVDGQRIPVGTKPLELLHELLLRAGEAVSKDELLDAVWPNLSVVEASLPTAVLKLRRALKDEKGEGRIIETVAGIGYRLAIPVEVESAPLAPELEVAAPPSPARGAAIPARPARRYRVMLGAGLAVALVAGTLAISRLPAAAPTPAAIPSQRDAQAALRRLDVGQIETMLAAGWDPNTPFNEVGDPALNILLGVCEWNPAHDRQRLLLMARTLLEGGARLDTRNGYGDTAYSIAAAPRYCGPDHPVTRMLHTLCYAGDHAPGDACLPVYPQARNRPPEKAS